MRSFIKLPLLTTIMTFGFFYKDFSFPRKSCHLAFTRLRFNKIDECHVLKDYLLKVYSNKCNQYVQVKDVHCKRKVLSAPE
ncbi:hypothetical protein AOLI_G00158480 [Acnodon oligacanthus]